MNSLGWILFLVVALVIAVLIAVVGCCLLLGVIRFGRRAGQQSQAIVVRTEMSKTGDEGVFYYPVMKFAAAGKTFEVKSTIGYPRPPYEDGSQVIVHYPQDNPAEAQLTRYQLWWFAALPIAVGGGFGLAIVIELVQAIG